MKVSFRDFSPNVPYKDHYEYVVDYISHELDLEFEDAFYLIGRLRNEHSSVCVFAPAVAVDFHIFEGELTVEIDNGNLWVAGDITLQNAGDILQAAYDGCEDFGQFLPNTTREWDAYFL